MRQQQVPRQQRQPLAPPLLKPRALPLLSQ
jgi:hypothetical protein